ncbi:MAG: hypothetical protein C5B49_04870 [Bdellovibrio sp.]|nr:MAG: hypothetical protein C5B49_04870 [Bdellovibrio sp.]
MSFLPIRVSTLRGDQAIDFDTYVKINEKQILYLRKGDSFEGPRLKRLKGKKLKKMYIMENDEGLYRNYLTKNIEMAYDPKSEKSVQTRSEIIQGLQQSNAEAVIEDVDNAEAYQKAKDECARFVDFLIREDEALVHIIGQENLDKNLAHHGVTVATLATAIAKRLGTVDPRQIHILSLGALIHDIEHFYTALDVARPRSAFTPVEAKVYQTHPTDGARRLSEKRHMDPQVVKIIAQHEEQIDGKGFPVGLQENQLDPLAQIVSSANALDRLITFENVPRNSSVKKLMINHVGSYPLSHIQILGDIVG